MTSIAKYRHLSRCSTPSGHFTILAIDHRTNLLNALNKHAPTPLDDAAFTAFKQEVIGSLGTATAAVLTDPAYGIGAGVASGALHGQLGLLAPLEVTDYDLHPSERPLAWIEGWSVAAIKRCGGDGVKLLLPYHPQADNAAHKRAAVQQIVAECATHEIPFYLEPIPYALSPQSKLSNAELLSVTLEMAQTFSALGVDVLKLAFPVDVAQSQDIDEWRAACEAVNAACGVPWALLSGGTDYATFRQQTLVACRAGASGVIVGRALWAEAVTLQGVYRTEFLRTTARERLQELTQICQQYGAAWQTRIAPPYDGTDWYLRS